MMRQFKEKVAHALGFSIVIVIGFAAAPWLFKAIVWIEGTVFPWYFHYFSRVMGME